jgi:hypothetical protein
VARQSSSWAARPTACSSPCSASALP